MRVGAEENELPPEIANMCGRELHLNLFFKSCPWWLKSSAIDWKIDQLEAADGQTKPNASYIYFNGKKTNLNSSMKHLWPVL